MNQNRAAWIGVGVVGVLVAAILAWLFLGGDDETAPGVAADAGRAVQRAGEAVATAIPLSYEDKTAHAEVALTFPSALKSVPDLHQALYEEGVRELKAFAEGAVADRTQMQGEGPAMPPYTRNLDWKVAAETGKLISLREERYEFAGGAHPNTDYGARLWDKALKRLVQPTALFRRDADWSVLDRALCDGLKAAKRERLKAEWTPDEVWSCPKARETQFVLAPSANGKAGGITFLMPPYAVGAYAEGPYEVTVPFDVFRAQLAPAYADEFAGRPQARAAA